MDYYVHDLNPIAFEIFGTPVAWYWLAYLFGFSFVYFFGLRMIVSEKLNINQRDFSDLMAFGWLGLILSARLFYVVVYNPDFYMENPSEIIKIWNGGMSFHGALVGVVVTVFSLAYLRKISIWPFFDLVAMFVPFTLGVGRLTNFINGELAGRPTDMPWAVIFPRYNDQIPRHPSQLYQAVGEGFFLFLLLYLLKGRLKDPGRMSSFFLIGYGTIRFSTEYFRAPDAQLGLLALNLTMGQVLCLIMITAGFSLIALRPKAH